MGKCGLKGYPKPLSYEYTKKIKEQMEKNICKIEIGDKRSIGFFCKIPFPTKDKMLNALITNNPINNEDILNDNIQNISLKIKEDEEHKEIHLNNRIIYTNKEYNTTIIEIKDEDEINYYLELDDNIINDILYNNNKNSKYKDKTIYIIQYQEGELSLSYGIYKMLIKKINIILIINVAQEKVYQAHQY